MASANGRSSASISITLDLISIPVKMYSSTSDHKGQVSFKQISLGGNTINQKTFDSVTGLEVNRSDLRKGYKDGDDIIIFEADEIKALESHKSVSVQIEQFVPLRSVNMAHVEKTYNCNPDPKAGVDKAFLAMSMTLAAKEVGGVAKWYAKGRENLVVITGNGESIQVHQMKYENEINKFSPECAKVDVHEQELAFLGLLIDSQTVESYGHSDENPGLYRDCHAERVREAVNDKRAGVQVKASKKAGSPVGGDLLSMLQASVKNIEVKKHTKGKALTQKIVTDANNESYAEGIFENKDGTFQALTPTKSSSFKTRGGAERWLYRATNGRLGKASAGSKK